MWSVFQISSTDHKRFEEREQRLAADQDDVLRVLKENIERSMRRRPVEYRADPNATRVAIARATLRFLNNSRTKWGPKWKIGDGKQGKIGDVYQLIDLIGGVNGIQFSFGDALRMQSRRILIIIEP